MFVRLTLFWLALLTGGEALGQPSILTRDSAETYWPRNSTALAHVVRPDGSWTLASLSNPVRPNDVLAFWGTGFRSGADLEVVVGNQSAPVLYAGRSGCCADLDQVVIQVPSGIEGCFVPVWFRLPATRQTEQVSVAISGGGGACQDLPSQVVHKLDTEGALWMGFVSPSVGTAAFGRVPFLGPAPMGTCRLGYIPPGDIELSYGDYNRSMVANAVNITGPQGLSVWPWSFWGGMYLSPRYGTETRAAAGDYTVDNGEGGYNFRPFKVAFTVPNLEFAWTNRDSIGRIRRSDGAEVTWSGGDPNHGFAVIFGETFACFEDARKGRFTIPPYVLDSVTRQLRLTVAFQSDWRRLTLQIPELDLAFASYHIGSTHLVEIE